MQIDFDGKLAIVTGSTTGIGFATAHALAQAGARVVISGRTQGAVERAVTAINTTRPRHAASGVAADLATAEGAATLIAAHPQADILINNLGIYEARAAARSRRGRLAACIQRQRDQRSPPGRSLRARHGRAQLGSAGVRIE